MGCGPRLAPRQRGLILVCLVSLIIWINKLPYLTIVNWECGSNGSIPRISIFWFLLDPEPGRPDHSDKPTNGRHISEYLEILMFLNLNF